MNLINKNSREYLDYLRAKRKPLLEAFDIHKTNVYYGICVETQEERKEIVEWYYKLLELDENAIANVPTHIRKHLK